MKNKVNYSRSIENKVNYSYIIWASKYLILQ